MPEPRACPYAEAARAVKISLDRAEHTAANVSGFIARVPRDCSETHRVAEALIAEWQDIQEHLRFALSILTLASENPDAFLKFKFEIENAPTPESLAALPPERRTRTVHGLAAVYPAAAILAVVKAMAGRA